MQTASELHARLMDRASNDDVFRSQLIEDPKAAIHDELGFKIPADITIKVHENDSQTVHLAVPASDIPEEQLEAISAGFCAACACS